MPSLFRIWLRIFGCLIPEKEPSFFAYLPAWLLQNVTSDFGCLIPEKEPSFFAYLPACPLHNVTSDLRCFIPERIFLRKSTDLASSKCDLWFRVFYPWKEPSVRIDLPDFFRMWAQIFGRLIPQRTFLRISNYPWLFRMWPRISDVFSPKKNLVSAAYLPAWPLQNVTSDFRVF